MTQQQQYDYTQDKDFLASKPEDQRAYLLANDPDFAKAGASDQEVYLAHLRGQALSQAPAHQILAAPSTSIAPPKVGPGISQGPTMGAAPSPSIYDRLTATVADSAVGRALQSQLPSVSKALGLEPRETVYSPSYQQHAEQLIAPEQFLSPSEQRKHPMITGTLQMASGLSTPENMLLMLGLPQSKLISWGFTAAIAHGVLQQSPQFMAAWKANDIPECQRIATQMLEGAWMAKLSAQHAITGGPKLSSYEEFIKSAPSGERAAYEAAVNYAGAQGVGGPDVGWLQSRTRIDQGTRPEALRPGAALTPKDVVEAWYSDGYVWFSSPKTRIDQGTRNVSAERADSFSKAPPVEARSAAVIERPEAKEAPVPAPPSQSVSAVPIPEVIAPPRPRVSRVETAALPEARRPGAALTPKDVVEAVYSDGYVWFNFPKTRSTDLLPKEDKTPEAVQAPEPIPTPEAKALPEPIQDSITSLAETRAKFAAPVIDVEKAKAEIAADFGKLSSTELFDMRNQLADVADKTGKQADFIRQAIDIAQRGADQRRLMVEEKAVGYTKEGFQIDPETDKIIPVERHADVRVLGRSLRSVAVGQVPRVTPDMLDYSHTKVPGMDDTARIAFLEKMKQNVVERYNKLRDDITIAGDTGADWETSGINSRINELERDARAIGKFPSDITHGRRPLQPVVNPDGTVREMAPYEDMNLKRASQIMGRKVHTIPTNEELEARANELNQRAKLHQSLVDTIDDIIARRGNKERGAVGVKNVQFPSAIPVEEQDFSSGHIFERAAALGLEPKKVTFDSPPGQDGWLSADGKVYIGSGHGQSHNAIAAALLPETDKLGSAMRAMLDNGWLRVVSPTAFEAWKLDPKTISTIENASWWYGSNGHAMVIDTRGPDRMHSLMLDAGWENLSQEIAKQRNFLKIPEEAGVARGIEIMGGMGLGGVAGVAAGGALGGAPGAVIGGTVGAFLGAVSPALMHLKPVREAFGKITPLLNMHDISLKSWLEGPKQEPAINPDMREIQAKQQRSMAGPDFDFTKRLVQLPGEIQRKLIDRFVFVNDHPGPLNNLILRLIKAPGQAFRDLRGNLSVDDSPYVTIRSALGLSGGAQAMHNLGYSKIIEEAQKGGIANYLYEYLNLKGGFERTYDILNERLGRAKSDIQDINTKLQDPNLSIRQKVALEDDLAEAKAVQEHMEYRIGSGEATPMGFTPEKTQRALGDMQAIISPEKFKAVTDLANRVFDQNRTILDMIHQNGLIGDDEYQTYIARGNEYIPMTRIMDNMSANTLRFQGKESPYYLRQQNVIKALEGSERVPKNPIQASADANGEAIREVVRNNVIGDFLKLAHDDPKGVGSYFTPVSADYKAKAGEALVGHYENGVVKTYSVPDWLGQTLQNASPITNDLMGGVVARWTAQVLRKGATAGNLAYTSMRAIRDTMGAAILSEGGIRKETPLKDIQQLGTLWAKNLYESLSKGPAWQEYMKSGGAFGVLQRNITPDHFISLDNLGWTGKLAKGRMIDTVSDFNAAMEDAIKMTHFQRLREMGYSVKAAQWEMRRYGGAPDYSRAGELGPVANLLFMFFNAKLQDTTRVFAKFAENPARMSVFLGGLTAMAMTLAEHNIQQKDENGKPLMPRVSVGDRERNFCFLTGQTYQSSSGATLPIYYKIPKPDVVRILVNPIENTLNKLGGRETRSGEQLALDEISGMIPGQFALKEGHLGKTALQGAASALNPALRIPAEQFMNYQFAGTGGPIVPEREQGIDPRYQYGIGTSAVARTMGEGGLPGAGAGAAMGGAMGGMYYGVPGALVAGGIGAAVGAAGLSPRRIDAFMRGTTAGAGEIATTALDPFMGQRTKEVQGPEAWRQQPGIGPIISRFVSSPMDQQEHDLQDRFYNNIDKVTPAYKTFKDLEKRDPDEAGRYLAANRDSIQKGSLAVKMQEKLAYINSMQRQLEQNPQVSPQDRQKYLKNMHDAKLNILQAFVGILEPTPSGNVNTGWSPMGTTAK